MNFLKFKPVRLVPTGTKFHFVSHYKIAIVETIILGLLTIGLLATLGLNFGIDFRGGTLMEIRMPGAANIADMRSKIEALKLGDVQIQQFGAPTDVMIRIAEQPGGEKAQQEAVAKVRGALGESVDVRRAEVVGATVSAELLRSAIIALAIAALGIFLFVWLRFEWQFSVAAIVALLHDVAATLCLFSILRIDFDLTVVAGFLTIIGFAVNDTVVMFDRVRENLRRYKKMPLAELIDLSINETLSRTAMTAGAVFITLIALYFFGGEVIRGFTLAILFGMTVSTYTSLYVAAPLLYLLDVKRDWSGIPGSKRREMALAKTRGAAEAEAAPEAGLLAAPKRGGRNEVAAPVGAKQPQNAAGSPAPQEAGRPPAAEGARQPAQAPRAARNGSKRGRYRARGRTRRGA